MFEFLKKLKEMRKKSKYLYRSMAPQPNQSPDLSSSNLSFSSPTNEIPYVTWTEDAKKIEQKDTRIEKRPVEVVKEILINTPKVNLDSKYLDKQLKIVKRRREILREELDMKYTSDEDLAISYLEARKNIVKCKGVFGWAVTNDVKINDLCSKYKLQKVSFNSFYRNIPMEAIDEIEKYTKLHKQVTKYAPELSLIIDAGGKETKKDPILLAKSPFGNWYFILGAWDKEVEVVDDLVYKNK